jgi:NitT/TauT family transport system ATP-binding protein
MASTTSRPPATAGFLRVDGVRKTYGGGQAEVVALRDIRLEVAPGEFLAVVGPSGCGKSTLLQIVAGLVPASAGAVSVDGARVAGPPDSMVYLFQQYAKSLFPWRTVLENVTFAIEHRMKGGARAVRARAMPFLEMVGLADFARLYPWQLSGGMQQRVSIARALAAEPRILLLDEPFSSVDALTRLELHTLILDLWSKRKFTVVLVTHDVDEAVFLADRVAVLSGRPAVVSEIIATDLPRPRDPIRTRELPRFLELRHRLLDRLLGRAGHA